MKRSIAYYHLPGLFEFYELYKVFLPLFQEHREYFYDWCDIGSVYGTPADCIWGGGRAGFGDDDAKKVLDLMKGYGILCLEKNIFWIKNVMRFADCLKKLGIYKME